MQVLKEACFQRINNKTKEIVYIWNRLSSELGHITSSPIPYLLGPLTKIFWKLSFKTWQLFQTLQVKQINKLMGSPPTGHTYWKQKWILKSCWYALNVHLALRAPNSEREGGGISPSMPCSTESQLLPANSLEMQDSWSKLVRQTLKQHFPFHASLGLWSPLAMYIHCATQPSPFMGWWMTLSMFPYRLLTLTNGCLVSSHFCQQKSH